MEKIDTLYASIRATNAFDELIRNVIYEDREYTSDLLDPIINKSLKAALVKIMILSMKEDIILKPKNSTYTNNLLFSAIESLASKIAIVNEDDTINLSGHMFSDGNDLVAKIRNKFAHGDYVYSDDCDNIIFNFDGDAVPVSLDALINFAFDLYHKQSEYKKTNIFHKPLWVFSGIKQLPLGLDDIVSDSIVKEMLDLYYEYDFELKASEGIIPIEAYKLVDQFQDRINNVVKKNRNNTYETIMRRVNNEVENCLAQFNAKAKSKKWNVSISSSLLQLTDEQKIRTFDTFKKIKGGDLRTLVVADELPRYASRHINIKNNKDIMNAQMAISLNIIDLLGLCSKPDINRVLFLLADKIKHSVKIDQDMYGLIQVLRMLDFAYMFENFEIDYDKLPLDGIVPSICIKKDNDLIEMENKVNSTYQRIAEQEDAIKKTSEQLSNVMKKDIPESKRNGILKTLGDKLLSMQKDNELFKTSYNYYVKTVNDIKEDREINKKYYDNKYLVERIRDSISHGNVYIIPNGKIHETILRFEDIFEDQVVFSVDIRLDVFKSILDKCTNKLAHQEVKIRNK